nr:GNAT family N-acetyltransferase [Nocardioides flavescens]
MRLHVVDDLAALVEPDRPGRARLATAADEEVAFAWFTAFHHDAAVQAGRDPAGETEVFEGGEVQARVESGRVWLWEDADGVPVSLVAHNPSAGGVVRIGPVFTPPEQRGRGWAGALTAHVTRRILEDGDLACLFTDVDNPVSNHVYAAIGYRAVVDMANLVIEPPN